MSNLLNSGPLTPSETYSDSDEDRYNSPKTSPAGQQSNYDEYPTPSTVNEASNDADDRYSNFQNTLPTNFSIGNLAGMDFG